MGKPVKIYDLAKKMVLLSGHTESEIPIVEVGIRPGENSTKNSLGVNRTG